MSRVGLSVAVFALASCIASGTAMADEWSVDDHNDCSRNAREAAQNREVRRRSLERAIAEADGTGGPSFNSMSPAYRFSEKGYLACNPDVARLIAEGRYVSAAHHYCTVGSSESRRSVCSDARTGPMRGGSGGSGRDGGAYGGGRGGRGGSALD